MFIVLLNVVPASSNNSIVEITFYSHNCVGLGNNKFITAAFLQAVTNFLIYSVTEKHLVVGQPQNEDDCSLSLIEKNIKRSVKIGPVLFLTVFCNYSNCKEERRAIQSSRLDCDSFVLDLREVIEQNAVNCTVDVGGVKL
jgi:hypothetical protein